MQDIHSIGGVRIFGGGGGGDRRLRPLHQQNHQALKCPRCDSLNTKFCYYNNYNLSQPRHFCKNCRRYWTKGGVLRNVPVGGGCRKAKRNSKPKPVPDSSPQQQEKERKASTNSNDNNNNNNNNIINDDKSNNNNNSNSSASDSSSSLTVTNNTNVETVSVHSSSGSVSNVFNFTVGCAGDDNNGGFNQLEQGQDCGNIFPDIGSLTSLITSSSNEPLHFGFNNFLNVNPGLRDDNHVHQQWQHQQENHNHQQGKMLSFSSVEGQENLKNQAQAITGGVMIDQTVGSNTNNNGGFGPLDWQGTGGDDQGLFDLPSTVDHSSYWSQSTHEWTGHQDHSTLYLP